MENLKALAYELRENVIDMIVEGKAGHIGGDMSVMEILTEIYFEQMNISPENQDDPDRDKFIMSKGHSVEAYYAVLARKGFFDIKEVIATFSKFGSMFIGHPNNKLPGIRDEFRFPGPWAPSQCGNGSGGKDGRQGLPGLHRDGRRGTGGRFRLGRRYGGPPVWAGQPVRGGRPQSAPDLWEYRRCDGA